MPCRTQVSCHVPCHFYQIHVSSHVPQIQKNCQVSQFYGPFCAQQIQVPCHVNQIPVPYNFSKSGCSLMPPPPPPKSRCPIMSPSPNVLSCYPISDEPLCPSNAGALSCLRIQMLCIVSHIHVSCNSSISRFPVISLTFRCHIHVHCNVAQYPGAL